jgi:LysR family transcriptional regulator, glycine cleavage system transcriptional activator
MASRARRSCGDCTSRCIASNRSTCRNADGGSYDYGWCRLNTTSREWHNPVRIGFGLCMPKKPRIVASTAQGTGRRAGRRPDDLIPPFAALRAFDAVGSSGGMRRAAAILGVDHTVISRHIHLLEKWMGVALVERADGAARLNERGRQYHASISRAIADIITATMDARHRAEIDRIRIWCVPGFGFQWLAPQLTAFRAAFPQCQIEFHPTDDAPDFSRDNADVDIRFVLDDSKAESPRNVKSFEFSRPRGLVVASPRLASALPKVATPADLLNVPLIHEEDDVQWRAWFHHYGVDTPARLPGIRVWHAHVVLEAARNSEGVALSNSFLSREDLLNGRLVLVGPKAAAGFPIVIGAYRLSARESEWDIGPVRRFRHWLLKAVANHQTLP